jgi:predicted N-acetyltransferase YhbS
MYSLPFTMAPQTESDSEEVEGLLDQCFGLARRTKTTYRLREGERPVDSLGMTARDETGRLVGANSFWVLAIGEAGTPALLLGPLAVAPHVQGLGVGRALMRRGIADARDLGHSLILLVGDAPYYERVGFRRVPPGQLLLQGPVDPARFLYFELEPGSLEKARGLVIGKGRFNGLRDTRWQPAQPTGERG